MDDLTEKLNQVLSDPEQMARIMELAGKFGAAEETAEPDGLPFSFAPDQIGRIMAMFGSGGKEEGLVRALRPYLPPEKAQKMSRAIRCARLSKVISNVLQEQSSSQEQ